MRFKLLPQIRERRLEMAIKEEQMSYRTGISKQRYRHLEAEGNPTLRTLDKIAAVLGCQLMLIPDDKISAVLDVLYLDDEDNELLEEFIDDLWHGLISDDEDD
jgi:transcriptional regulator with XRE-family HTH domain